MSNSVERAAPVILVVLDGWGWRTAPEGNAIALADTPTWDRLVARAPRTLLEASGLRVGLPEGQMGNSEVGHLNLGAGRVVPQDLVRINQSIDRGEFARLPALAELAAHVRQTGGTVHLVALLGAAPLWAAAAFLALWYGAEAGFAHALGLTLGPRDLAAMVLRDVAQPAIWVATFARRGFEWRGNDMAAAPV